MAILAPVIPFLIANAATITSVGSMAMAGIAAKQQADYQSDVARANAEESVQNARREETAGQHERDRLRLENRGEKARGQIAYAGGGVQLGAGGSAGTWEDDLGTMLDIDVANSVENAGQRGDAQMRQAQNFNMEANAAQASGRNALFGSAMQAGGSILSGASKSKWGQKKRLRSSMIANNNAYFANGGT